MTDISKGELDLVERPLLVFKVGVFGSTPLGFGEGLAREFDAQFFSSDALRMVIREQRERAGNTARVDPRAMGSLFKALAKPLLASGQDVFADIFYNTPNSRYRTPLSVARDTNATTVALNIHAPDELVEERVRQWVREDTLGIPLADWEVHPLAAVRHTYTHLEFADAGEDIDFVFDVDGSADLASMIDQVDGQLLANGLTE